MHSSSAKTILHRLLLLLLLATIGCALVVLQEEVKDSQASTVLVGWVESDAIDSSIQENSPLVVAAYSMQEGKRTIAHYTVLHQAGEYELMVTAGQYYVCAYWDLNHNLVYDAGEPAGQYGEPRLVNAEAGGVILEINFAVGGKDKGKRRKIDLPQGFAIAPRKDTLSTAPLRLQSRQAGALVKLNDERFSAENGNRGLWRPSEFYRELGGNIYFIEEYDPKKIPILFIHGASGTPREWEYIIANLDRERFQPWLYFYPSGSRLQGVSYLLYWKLYNLQMRYRFDTLFITAHSMGGLLARSFLIDHGRDTPYVKLFVSLATPWGGVKTAEYGVKQSPAVIPSWIDLQPEGEFIQSLYQGKLPASLSFYMFSGHRGNRNPLRAYNDGSVDLSSLLDVRAQAEAKMNYTYNEDHTSILNSPTVMTQYRTILHTYAGNSQTEAPIGGYLKVRFAYDYPIDDSRPRPILVLRPSETTSEEPSPTETEIHLSPEDSNRRIGPIPVGPYTVSLVAPAVRPDKHQVPVTIASDRTHSLEFVFRPDGMIYGNVAAAQQTEDRMVGMPTERVSPQSKSRTKKVLAQSVQIQSVTLQSVTLKGNGVEKTLRPMTVEQLHHEAPLLSSTDYCTHNYFHFFGLAAGSYAIKIVAKGFKPTTRTYVVKPGRPPIVRDIELVAIP